MSYPEKQETDFTRRVAVFDVSLTFIEREPEIALEVFKQLRAVPIRAEVMLHRGAVEYIACSDQFPVVPIGAMPTRITVCVDMKGGEMTPVITYVPERN